MVLATVDQIFVHPIKGLSPKKLKSAELVPGRGIPGDRAYALLFLDCLKENSVEEYPWGSKRNFAMQAGWPALATLECRFGEVIDELEIFHHGKMVFAGSLKKERDRAAVSEFFSEFLLKHSPAPGASHPHHAPVKVVGGYNSEVRYPDRNTEDVSLLNMASLRALESEVGAALDIRSFRGNIVFESPQPWVEKDLVGKEIKIGNARIGVKAFIGRCFNINVLPESGEINPDVLPTLARLQRGKFGILGTVLSRGSISTGDAIEVVGEYNAI